MIPAHEYASPVIVITGPTAAGKTAVALELCQRLGGEIVNADAMQIYRGMDIGTAKPSLEERAAIPHHLIDIRDPSDAYSVADYVPDATGCIRQIRSRGHVAVVCGGTGLYVQSLMEGLEFPAGARSDSVRNRLEAQANEDGVQALLERLREVDPETAGRLCDTDRRRIIRALEVYETTGITATKMREESRLRGSPFVFLPFCLTLDRTLLYARIEARIDRMMMDGLPEEAARIFAAPTGNTACQAIGYKEFLPYVEGHATLEEVTLLIKQATRNYAKRQLTWFRRMKTLAWMDNANPGTTVKQIMEYKILD